MTDLDLFEAAERDAILEQHDRGRSALLTTLRAAAFDVWRREQRPVSANDVRDSIPSDVGDDRRFLGRLFTHPDWTRVGSTQTDCEGATIARVGQGRGSIGTYEPTYIVRARVAKAEAERRTA